MWAQLWTFYQAGGWVMHPITVCSLVVLIVVLWKIAGFRRVRLDYVRFLADVRAQLLNGRLRDATALCEARSSPVATVVKAGLTRHSQPRADIEAAMEVVARHEIAHLGRGLGALATIANLAPLLGFFGTVWGMIVAFDVIYQRGLGNPALVAGGISQALYTTAWGLIVAFVALPVHNVFAGRIATESRKLELATSVVLETFAEMERLGTKA